MPITTILGSAVGAVCTCLKCLYDWSKPDFDYVKDLDKNFKRLEGESERLAAVKTSVTKYMGDNETAMERTAIGGHLLKELKTTEEKIAKIKKERQKTNRCLLGMCPFLKLRKLGKDIVKTTDEVVRIRSEMIVLMPQDQRLMTVRAPEEVQLSDPTKIVELKSLTENVQELLKLLRDNKLNRVGIFGMEGIGKTTLLEKLRIEVDKQSMFDIVIFVSVKGEDRAGMIQKVISSQLNTCVNYTSSNISDADTISEGLAKMKYLVLLDHVSSSINLHEVGIRGCHTYGKVVFACRQKSVCKSMGAVDFHVKNLKYEDSLTLFETIVGDVVKRPRFKIIGEEIVEELGGLPRLIKAAATNLRNEYSEPTWKNALFRLRSPIDSQQQNLQDVFKSLGVIFDQLLDDKQKCLQYVSLFPRDYFIYEDYLVECWALEYFNLDSQPIGRRHNVHQFRVARDKGLDVLNDLINTSFLERCTEKVKYIWMPEQVRKLIDDSYPEDCRPLVEAGRKIEEPPKVEDWIHAERISLMCNRLRSLPEKPKCTKTSTLLLQKNEQLQSIPKSFFGHMGSLKVLDLYQTGIETLPKSLFSLTQLRGLYLNQCRRLTALSGKIAKLENLEVLDIQGTGIRSLPIEIGELGNLKCFRVSFLCTDAAHEKPLDIIPPNVINKLHKLEELTIIVDPKEQSWNRIVDDIVNEVASLKLLTTLCFQFLGVKSLRTFLEKSTSWNNTEISRRSNGFRSYKMLVGNQEASHPNRLNRSASSYDRILRFSTGESIPLEIEEVLKQASTFELIGHSKVQSLSEFGLANMKSLEVCVIERCDKMESIVDGNSSVVVGPVFPELENLHMFRLEKLNCIWRSVEPGSLVKLKTLTLKDCHKLTNIFSHEIAQQLKQLQCLTVENCCQVKEIIEVENHSSVSEIVEVDREVAKDDKLSGALPNLDFLELVQLPNLDSICRSDALGWLSLKKIKISGCGSLCNLSLSTTNASGLQSIFCNEVWWNRLKLQHGLRKRLDKLCCFIDEEPPHVNGTPPEATPGHGVGHEQPHDSNVPANLMNKHASSSTIAEAIGPPADPSSLSWAEQESQISTAPSR